MSAAAARAAFAQASREALPAEQREALRKAVRWQWFTVCYTAGTITLVAFVLGNSQAMRTAWIEDMLSLIPQIAFLVSLVFVRRRSSRRHPYGWHRSTGIGHLVAGVALLAVGLTLALESLVGLIAGDRPTIGTVQLFGETVWMGWLMVVVMAVIVVGPVALYGPVKKRLAPVLHNKLLYADADMAKADWQTNAASIIGVLGVGAGVWWLDGAAAVFIAIGIILDGVRNTRAAVSDLMDRRARTTDDAAPHPIREQILTRVREFPWVTDAGVRIRDEGQVFHAEIFVQPDAPTVELEQLNAVCAAVSELDWKVQDVVVVATDPLPDYTDR